MKRTALPALAAVSLLFAVPSARAEGVATIENFDNYSSGVGSWTYTNNGIAGSLNLNTNSPIEGSKDLGQTLGVGLLGAGYTISNQSLDVTVPVSATNFRFKHRSLLGLSVGKTVVVTLKDENNVDHVSPSIPITLLQVNNIIDYSTSLASFTPSAAGGSFTKIKGISMQFSATTSVNANESLDSIRLTWDNTSVEDWNLY